MFPEKFNIDCELKGEAYNWGACRRGGRTFAPYRCVKKTAVIHLNWLIRIPFRTYRIIL